MNIISFSKKRKPKSRDTLCGPTDILLVLVDGILDLNLYYCKYHAQSVGVILFPTQMSKDHKRRNANSNDDDITNNMINHNCVKFVIWHTLRKLPEEEEAARTVRLENGNGPSDNNTCVMTHDWNIHLDVIEGDPRPIIAQIEADFGPNFLRRRLYVSNRHRKKLHNQKQRWRCFESRQKCAGTPSVQFRIVGMGGTILRVKSDSDLEPVEGYFFEKNISTFGATDELPNLLPIPLPADRAFSLEQVSIPTVNSAHMTSEKDMLQSTSWEMGEQGIKNIRDSLIGPPDQTTNDSKMVNTIISVQLCEDNPNNKDLENITKICQNFIKYEDAIDTIVQNSRDSIPLGIPTPPSEGLVVHSNKSDVQGETNRSRHDTLEACSSSIEDLVKAMNPRENQIYKLVLAKEQKWSARFFFCAVPEDVDFTMGLLRFCTLFVHNSFRFQKPKPLKSSRSIEDQIEFLFAMVVRDRFVEEMLLQGGNSEMSLCSSFQLDMDSMQDEEASFPLSLVHTRAEDDDFSAFSDVRFPDRKRPRPMSPPLSNATQDESVLSANGSQSSNVDVVLRSHLCIENKYYTAAKLATMGKNLSTGTSNSKTERLLRLKAYFDARDDELNKYFENDDHDSGILGIEFVFQNDQNRDDNNICVILKGGWQMTIPRRSVCESKYGEKEFPIKILEMSEERAKTIFENLYPKETIVENFDGYISRIDNFIDDLQKDQDGTESNPCRFALIHDLF